MNLEIIKRWAAALLEMCESLLNSEDTQASLLKPLLDIVVQVTTAISLKDSFTCTFRYLRCIIVKRLLLLLLSLYSSTCLPAVDVLKSCASRAYMEIQADFIHLVSLTQDILVDRGLHSKGCLCELSVLKVCTFSMQAAKHTPAIKARVWELIDILLGWALDPALPDPARLAFYCHNSDLPTCCSYLPIVNLIYCTLSSWQIGLCLICIEWLGDTYRKLRVLFLSDLLFSASTSVFTTCMMLENLLC